MQIAVGSTNPVKIRAVTNIARKIYPRAQISGIEVPSGVPAQPRGDKQTQRGAINRARAARQALRADWGVGLEGGILENKYGTMTCAWVAIVDRTGHIGIGGSTNMLLPRQIASHVKRGAELGDAMDEFAKIRGVKRKMGAIGVLTKGLFDRRKSYEFLFALAAARFLWRGKYGK